MAFCVLFFCNTNAQEDSFLKKEIEYYNNFQDYTNNKPNADSAFYIAQILASDNRYINSLRDLLHNSFAQFFIERKTGNTISIDPANNKLLFHKELLMKMVSDTTKQLVETIKPLYLWVKIQDNKNNITVLKDLTNEFIKTELSEDIFTNSVGRYGLLIYQIISAHEELKALSVNLFDKIYSNLQRNQIAPTDSSTRTELEKRAYYRYLFASANYIKAKQSEYANEKGKYLKTAFDYSPDALDKDHANGYFYDMGILFSYEEKPTFKVDYLEFLTSTSFDKQKILSLFLEAALVDPEYKNKLQELYNRYNSTGLNFNQYWRNAINAKAKMAPPVSLHLLDQEIFSTTKYLGNWVLVDFWGTWCGACRAEHHDMQKFYDSVVLKNSKNIHLFTIACKDTREKVLAYLKEKQFTFPVAMSDGKIENIYPVQGYPTKFLITPEGRYLLVPYGIDWANFVKQYCDL